MRLQTPRIAPVETADTPPESAALMERFRTEGRDYNIFRTFSRHPAAFAAFLPWGGHVLGPGNTLDPRERELLILRVGWLCRAGYEWSRHVPLGRRAGLGDAEIEGIKVGANAPIWGPADAALIRAADALVTDHFVPDATWSALAARLSERQLMDVVFTVGQYVMVSMFLNSAGVQLDPDVALDVDWKARR